MDGDVAEADRRWRLPQPSLPKPSLPQPSLELAHHLGVDLALEGNNETRQFPGRHPAPGLELGLMSAARGHVDFLLTPRETHGKPLLSLAAIAALEGDAHEIIGQVIAEPAGRFRQHLDARDASLLLQFTQRRRP